MTLPVLLTSIAQCKALSRNCMACTQKAFSPIPTQHSLTLNCSLHGPTKFADPCQGAHLMQRRYNRRQTACHTHTQDTQCPAPMSATITGEVTPSVCRDLAPVPGLAFLWLCTSANRKQYSPTRVQLSPNITNCHSTYYNHLHNCKSPDPTDDNNNDNNSSRTACCTAIRTAHV